MAVRSLRNVFVAFLSVCLGSMLLTGVSIRSSSAGTLSVASSAELQAVFDQIAATCAPGDNAITLEPGTYGGAPFTSDCSDASVLLVHGGGDVFVESAIETNFLNLTIEGGGFITFRNVTTGPAVVASNVIVKDAEFRDNSAGAIIADSADISSSTFVGNSSSLSGGAVAVDSVLVDRSLFRDNTSSGNGGAIYATLSTLVRQSAFEGNTADGNGGAISAPISVALVPVSRGGLGGGPFSTPPDISSSTFVDNVAITEGAAVYGPGGTYSHVTVVNNTSAGAAIYAPAGRVWNSLLVGNGGSNCDIAATFARGGPAFGVGVTFNSVSDDATCSDGGSATATDVAATAPLAADWPGVMVLPTTTSGLVAGVPCFEFGSDDQRGELRPAAPAMCTPGAVNVVGGLTTFDLTASADASVPGAPWPVQIATFSGPTSCESSPLASVAPGVTTNVSAFAYEEIAAPACIYRVSPVAPEGVLVDAGENVTPTFGGPTASLAFAFTAAPTPPTPTPAAKCSGKTVTVNLALGDVPTEGDDVILGTSGADTILALGGDDTICGGGGDDEILAGPGNDKVFGGAGADMLVGGGGSDALIGGKGMDTLKGSAGPDTLRGNGGADTLIGGGGADKLFGGSQGDTLVGGKGSDTLRGDKGADNLSGGKGSNDKLLGGGGADAMNGGKGAGDVCRGGGGTDTATASCEVTGSL